MDLPKDGREYIYWPLWSETTLTAVDIKVDDDWVAMESVPSYEPAEPVTAGAQWWRALIAGPLAASNPVGTAVLDESAVVALRIAATPEVIIRTGGLIRLTS